MSELSKAYMQYKENSIIGSKPEELTLMLYNGLVKYIMLAQTAIDEKNIEKAHNVIIKAQDIISEFQKTLDMQYEVSHGLMLLYDYMCRRLIEANIKKDRAVLDEVLEFARELRDTWANAVKIARNASKIASAEVQKDVQKDVSTNVLKNSSGNPEMNVSLDITAAGMGCDVLQTCDKHGGNTVGYATGAEKPGLGNKFKSGPAHKEGEFPETAGSSDSEKLERLPGDNAQSAVAAISTGEVHGDEKQVRHKDTGCSIRSGNSQRAGQVPVAGQDVNIMAAMQYARYAQVAKAQRNRNMSIQERL